LPKLLDYIKEKGLSHEEVIKLLEGMPEESDEEEDSEEEEETEETSDDSEDEDDTEIDEDNDDQEYIKVTKDQLSEMINTAIEEKLKARRKPPSKGKKGKPAKPKPRVPVNMFEVIV